MANHKRRKKRRFVLNPGEVSRIRAMEMESAGYNWISDKRGVIFSMCWVCLDSQFVYLEFQVHWVFCIFSGHRDLSSCLMYLCLPRLWRPKKRLPCGLSFLNHILSSRCIPKAPGVPSHPWHLFLSPLRFVLSWYKSVSFTGLGTAQGQRLPVLFCF